MKFLLFFLLVPFIILVTCSPSPDSAFSNSKNLPDKQENNRKSDQIVNQEEDYNPLESLPIQVRDLAMEGKVLSTEFSLKHMIKNVHETWGEPDKTDKYKEYFYATYEQRDTVFGFNEEGEIFDIRSYDEKLHSLTYDHIISALGKPLYTKEINEEYIYIYKLNNEIELKFISPIATGKVDHVSVSQNNKTAENSNNKEDYILEIKGISHNLSEKAWNNMLKSRAEMVTLSKRHPNDIYINGMNQKKVAITFDDGPDKIITPEIISTLASYKVKGNFFFVGEKVHLYPEVVKNAYQEGNLILSHSYYHNDLSKKSKNEIKEDLSMTNDAIQDAIGIRPALFRPPYGATSDLVISAAQNNHLKIVLWSIDTLDWSSKDSVNIQENVLNHVRNGDIILMHSDEDKTETAKALPFIIEGLQNKGFQIVTLDKLIQEKAYR